MIRSFKTEMMIACAASALALGAASAGAKESAASAGARETAAHRFDIPSQSLAQALVAYSAQSDTPVMVSDELVRGKSAPAVRGDMTPEAALRRLLSGSGLKIVRKSNGTVTIVPFDAAGPRAADGAGSAALGDDPDGTEIVVTGTKIRGVTDVAAPTITVDRRQIEAAGFLTVGDIARSLPQNFSAASPEGMKSQGVRGVAAQSRYTTSFDLRGLGPTATLVLTGGHRTAGNIQGRAVDISMIPLPLVDRVEIVSGGRSAIYGADAVGGVANFVLRRAFDGVQSDITYGGAEQGGERFQFTQTAGVRSDRGGFALAYDYTRERPLDLIGGPLIESPTSGGVVFETFNLNASTRRHTLYGSGGLRLFDGVEAYADASYHRADFGDPSTLRIPASDYVSSADSKNRIRYLSAGGGLKFDFGSDRQLDVSAYTSRLNNSISGTAEYSIGGVTGGSSSSTKDVSNITTISAVLDGHVAQILGMDIRGAAGTEYRRESLVETTSLSYLQNQDIKRTVRSLSGELQIPFIAAGTSPLAKSLILSIAARYDDYSDFGSSFNPQLGLIWEAEAGLRLRGTYSTAFKAPDLYSIGFQSSANVFDIPLCNSSNVCQTRPVLMLSGSNPDLQPEKARTWSVGIDYKPTFAPWLKLGASYLSIVFRGRVATPSLEIGNLAPTNLDLYPGLSNLNPTLEELTATFSGLTDRNFASYSQFPWLPDPSLPDLGLLQAIPTIAIFDNRLSNVANQELNAIDISVDASGETSFGRLTFGINATYTIKSVQQTTSESPLFSVINDVGRPPDFRMRANAGIERRRVSANISMDHVGGYPNSFFPDADLSSWTKFNVNITFRTNERDGIFKDITAALNIANIFDDKPPRFSGPNGLRYDAANASGIGRFVSVKISKKW